MEQGMKKSKVFRHDTTSDVYFSLCNVQFEGIPDCSVLVTCAMGGMS